MLEREDFSEFVRLHPHIWKHKNLQVDDTNIFSVNTELTAIEKDCLKELVSEEPTYVLVYTNKYGDKQVLFNHHNGTNGYEGMLSILLRSVTKRCQELKNISV